MSIKISVGEKQPTKELKVSLKIRKTIAGDLMIFDHKDIDIVVLPGKNKIATFPKNVIDDNVYTIQQNFFNFLYKKGIVAQESIRSGNVYASMEAEYPQETINNVSPIKAVVWSIYRWLEEEKPKMEFEEFYEQEIENRLLEPDEEESTELGEVPQEEKKGSLPQHSYYFPRYMYY